MSIFDNAFVYDIELYPNCFTLVARELDFKKYLKFVLHEDRDDINEILEWLDTKPTMIGYNNIKFDGQIIEYIYSNPDFTIEELYTFKEDLIARQNIDSFDTPYKEWTMHFQQIDLMKINHYDRKKISLKWLEFSMRLPKLADLPFEFDKNISKSNVSKLLTYNRNDVDATYEFFYRCKMMIDLRVDLAREYKEKRILNMSDSSLGSFIFEYELTHKYGLNKKKLKKGTERKNIAIKDCLVDYLDFETEAFNNVLSNYKNALLEGVDKKGIKGYKGTEQEALFEDMVFVYGVGGLHASYAAGEYVSDKNNVIYSIDAKSYYPNLGIENGFFPEHIGKVFCKVYAALYKRRGEYDKGTAMNYAIKIALNGVYGKSNAEHSIVKDCMYTLKITINGQLLMTMLAEELAKIGRLLMVNTDGVEVLIPRDKENELKEICAWWEELTNIELERDTYKKLIIKDVNNYIAVNENNKGKRKGRTFLTYYDFTEEDGKPHFYDKSPNATVIQQALYEYYANDVSVEETINNCNNIHEFMYGIKSQKGFDYWFIGAGENGVVDIDKKTEKVIRYYIANKGYTIYKHWNDNRKTSPQAVNKGQLVQVAMNIRSPEITAEKKNKETKQLELIEQFDVNREYYIGECYKIMEIISSGERDKAYKKYMKEHGEEE